MLKKTCILKINRWSAGSVVKHTQYTYREPEFGSQNSDWVTQSHLCLSSRKIWYL